MAEYLFPFFRSLQYQVGVLDTLSPSLSNQPNWKMFVLLAPSSPPIHSLPGCSLVSLTTSPQNLRLPQPPVTSWLLDLADLVLLWYLLLSDLHPLSFGISRSLTLSFCRPAHAFLFVSFPSPFVALPLMFPSVFISFHKRIHSGNINCHFFSDSSLICWSRPDLSAELEAYVSDSTGYLCFSQACQISMPRTLSPQENCISSTLFFNK